MCFIALKDSRTFFEAILYILVLLFQTLLLPGRWFVLNINFDFREGFIAPTNHELQNLTQNLKRILSRDRDPEDSKTHTQE
jgi:hypothetical protein